VGSGDVYTSRHESRVAFCWIHSPEEEDVGTVAYLSQRCAGPATTLRTQNPFSRRGGGCGVNGGAEQIGECYRQPLSLAGKIGTDVDQKPPARLQEQVSSLSEGVVQ
jgi:hypothetical protein